MYEWAGGSEVHAGQALHCSEHHRRACRRIVHRSHLIAKVVEPLPTSGARDCVVEVARGERIGLIKFGSRVDVLFDRDATIQVKPGDRVQGGATVLAVLPVVEPAQPVGVGASREREGSTWKN